MTNSENTFARLAAIDVSKHIEKKSNLSYLSWAWAVDLLMRADPAANWDFHDPMIFGETMMVSCTVTAFGKPIRMHLPVMDHRNQAIKNPDAFAVNKNMMRCLVKAIACHGLGLYIYAGEDLPNSDDDGNAASKPAAKPTAKPHDIGGDLMAIRECDDLAALKDIFVAAMAKASPQQKAELTDAKDARKAQLTTKEAA